jgi:DNA-binding response OmpR family regulator
LGLGERAKVVAVMTANQALSSILAAVLATSPGVRVRSFESAAGLAAYMHLAPVDLAVLDFEHQNCPADRVSFDLRHDAGLVDRDFSVIALTRRVNDSTRRSAVAAGIDEVIVKPMSPRYLLERVEARLRRTEARVGRDGYRGPERRGRVPATVPAPDVLTRSTDNVVQLFPADR